MTSRAVREILSAVWAASPGGDGLADNLVGLCARILPVSGVGLALMSRRGRPARSRRATAGRFNWRNCSSPWGRGRAWTPRGPADRCWFPIWPTPHRRCGRSSGVFTYLIAEGRKMADRDQRQAKAMQQQTDEYIRSVAAGDGHTGNGHTANGHSSVDDIARGKQLLDSGAITEDEFAQIKRQALLV